MRPQVKVVIVGHVDHGKSTFIGRLLHDTGSLPEGKLEYLQAVADRRGMRLELANVTDALQAERDQNITIDATQTWFRTTARDYVLIDAPGHREFLKNMVTGAAHADAACLIVDVSEGMRDQSRRHAYLLQLLGIRRLIVLVNKMDAAGFAESAFRNASDECAAFLAEAGLTAAAIVPIAARDGDNVAARSRNMPWWNGPSALQALDDLTVPEPDAASLPLRFPVQSVYRFDDRRIVAGRLESGTLSAGDRLVFFPGRSTATVSSIEAWPQGGMPSAAAPASIGITLAEPIFVERGHVATAGATPPCFQSDFDATVLWLGRSPLRRDRSYPLKLTTQTVDCWIERVHRVIDAVTLAAVVREHNEIALTRDDVAEVTIRTARPLAFDPYADIARFGRFVLMDGGVVSGGGVVVDRGYARPAETPQTAHLSSMPSQVTREQRAARNAHAGGVVWLTGLSGAGKSTIARALERTLFDLGRQVYVLDGDDVRRGLCGDLGFGEAARVENIRRVGEVARLFADAGLIVIVACISPYRSGRDAARAAVAGGRFLEVYVATPLAVCEARDVKGLYAKARSGEIQAFTGVSSAYEPPQAAEVELDTSRHSLAECVRVILDAMNT